MPATFDDPPNAGSPLDAGQDAAEVRSSVVVAHVRSLVLPRLVREAEDRGWWSPSAPGVGGARPSAPSAAPTAAPTVRALDAAGLERLALAPRVLPPFDPAEARAILVAAASAGGRVVAAASEATIVGAAVAGPVSGDARIEPLLAVGVAPAFRAAGLGRELVRALVDGRQTGVAMEGAIGTAERDVVEPLPVAERASIARRLLAGAGFAVRPGPVDLARDDHHAQVATLPPG
jgi:GNAT superfamily N-acetyltransferase